MIWMQIFERHAKKKFFQIIQIAQVRWENLLSNDDEIL